ncbi:MAG: hypothetical protein EXQ94_00190 [Alphaproteobacteria bacterium]|nr:hypothetical protein [Alphaproteobacteria bacterium]
MTLSIKSAPDDVVRRLKARAAKNHRSLQGELMVILERAADEQPVLSPREVLEEIRRMGLRTTRESTAMIRKDRDAR